MFSRVVEHRDSIDGLLRVLLVGFPGHDDGDIFNDRIVLTGIRSRPAVARDCQRRCPGLSLSEWLDLVDEACLVVRKVLEDGEPLSDLSQGEIEADPAWLVEPLLRHEEHAVLFGNGGTGKSTLAIALATLLTTGRSDWGLTVCGTERVLYLDYEDGENNIKRHLDRVALGLGVARPAVYYKRGDAGMVSIGEALARQCGELGITGLIIDSAALACGSEPETADAATGFFRTVRALPIDWSLTIAHQPKDKERADQPFGSSFWWNAPK